MWQATLIFHPQKDMFTDFRDFSSSYYAIMQYMFYTLCIFYFQKKIL